MRTTAYFRWRRRQPDRVIIRDEWIVRAIWFPDGEETQADGRIRRWVRIPEAHDRYLRVVLLADGITVHNAFFDRRYMPCS
jgi:hypothetical protein